MRLLNIIFFLVPLSLFGQETIFHADSSQLRSRTGNTQQSFDHAMKIQWRIKGQYLRWGNEIKVTPSSSGIDTIFFRQKEQEEWDTLICKVKPNATVRFVYNSCCSYFNVVDEVGHVIKGSVAFELKGPMQKNQKYLGSMDDNGILLTSSLDTISPVYRSPMFPNNYNVSIRTITKCAGENCLETVLIKPDGRLKMGYNYKVEQQLLNFRYLPLNEDPVIVRFDLTTATSGIE